MTDHHAGPTAPAVQGHPSGRARAKLLAAGMIVASFEWYDFALYGTAASLVFPHVFFPDSSATAGILLSFATFWAGFVGRPLGGLIAGHLGDRRGRKGMVIVSLALMGLGTFAIGCLPGARAIGVAAPILLVAVRLVQGLACGAQWGGTVLLLTESAQPKRKGLAGTFGQMGVSIGSTGGLLLFLLLVDLVSPADFLSWAWRIPFLVSILLFPVALYIHRKVDETPEFRRLAQQRGKQSGHHVVRAPVAEVIRKHWRVILLGAGLMAGTNAVSYVTTTGLINYATTTLGFSISSVLSVGAPIALAGTLLTPLTGWLSDRIGRRPVVLAGATLTVLWAFPYFWLVNTRSLALFAAAIFVGVLGGTLIYGPLAAYLSELFAPQVRYSGISAAYQLSSIAVGGASPLIMAAIIAKTGSTVLVSAYLAAMGAITLVCALVLRETNPEAVRNDPAAVPGLEQAVAAD
ncbi:MFS transporter [Amycolatopsis sp. Poz14]|uniref:MFS transporter n=1 Tax=Amycolatopsis sp. Poz14 TaxID=1447705 RepID=UPI001EE7CF62|nr:MFS transporter [Amycolatopsis sp. Poz14]MCG3751956.1 MHS family MFS transporter [Amycolatopsis sp. Poz14]